MSKYRMLTLAVVWTLPLISAAQAQSPEEGAKAASLYKAAEIMSSSQEDLVKILKDRNASDFDKAKACQRLALVGDKSAVPALAALLSNPKLSHYARTSLEPLPGIEADAALRDALGRLDGDLLIGVINSIGRRKDAGALDALAKLRHGDNLEISEAASAALGRIRSP